MVSSTGGDCPLSRLMRPERAPSVGSSRSTGAGFAVQSALRWRRDWRRSAPAGNHPRAIGGCVGVLGTRDDTQVERRSSCAATQAITAGAPFGEVSDSMMLASSSQPFKARYPRRCLRLAKGRGRSCPGSRGISPREPSAQARQDVHTHRRPARPRPCGRAPSPLAAPRPGRLHQRTYPQRKRRPLSELTARPRLR